MVCLFTTVKAELRNVDIFVANAGIDFVLRPLVDTAEEGVDRIRGQQLVVSGAVV